MAAKSKKTNKLSENYLLRVPVHPEGMGWSANDEGIVTLEKPNTGLMNKIAQLIFNKPEISYIHLDKHGSFAWLNTDGIRDITAIGLLVKERFGEEAEPLYERLAMFYQVMDSYGFIHWRE